MIDVPYFQAELKALMRTLDQRPNEELARYLRTLAEIAQPLPVPTPDPVRVALDRPMSIWVSIQPFPGEGMRWLGIFHEAGPSVGVGCAVTEPVAEEIAYRIHHFEAAKPTILNSQEPTKEILQ